MIISTYSKREAVSGALTYYVCLHLTNSMKQFTSPSYNQTCHHSYCYSCSDSYLFYPSYADRDSLKMLYLIGLGLADEADITVKGLNVVKSAHRVYLEAYTSILLTDKGSLVPTTDSAYMIWS